MRRVMPSSLLTCCHAGLLSMGVGAGLRETVNAFTSPPFPGGCGTDLIRLAGYCRYPGARSPSELPARSGGGKLGRAANVGSATLALPLAGAPPLDGGVVPAGAATEQASSTGMLAAPSRTPPA